MAFSVGSTCYIQLRYFWDMGYGNSILWSAKLARKVEYRP
jgi:hypothetical protein